MSLDVIALILIGALVAVAILYDALGRDPEPPDLDRSDAAERKRRMEARQKAAHERMKALGIKSLLDGRPAWQRINPMGVVPETKKVVRMRGKA